MIISYALWERSGFDRDILKQTVRLNGQDFVVVGVAPERFTGTTAMIGMEYFVPVGVHDAIDNDFDSDARFTIADRGSKPLIVIARLKPELTREQADSH